MIRVKEVTLTTITITTSTAVCASAGPSKKSTPKIKQKNTSLEWRVGCIMVDFGLSFGNPTPEDKAVDLYVLERALRSTHEESEGLFATVMQAYCDGSKGESEVVARLRKVQKRGRKRLCFG